jgi:preprotein translocase subunit YajC
MIDQLPLTLAQSSQPSHGVVTDSGLSANAPGGNTVAGQPGGTTGAGGGGLPAPRQDPFGGSLMFIVLAMVGVMLFMTWNSSRKEKKRRLNLLSNLKKGDKVATVSGIIGSVVELRDSEVVLKVDENSNTRIKFRKAAIETILDDRAPDAKD